MLARAKHEDHRVIAGLLNSTGWMPNGKLYQVQPETIGALTDAPIFSDEVKFDDDGTPKFIGNIWWFPNYQIESFAETPIKDGRVVFDKAA